MCSLPIDIDGHHVRFVCVKLSSSPTGASIYCLFPSSFKCLSVLALMWSMVISFLN